MKKRYHLHFNNQEIKEGNFRYRNRFPGIKDDEKEPNYTPLAEVYQTSINDYLFEHARRNEQRDRELEITESIEYIDIEFFSTFDTHGFENSYRRDFGIAPVKFYDFNKRVLFTIINSEKFENFKNQVIAFIETKDHNSPNYDGKIKFIKSFEFLSTEKILNEFISGDDTVYLNLTDTSDIFQKKILPIEDELKTYLEERDIDFVENNRNKTFELVGPTSDIVLEIARNFDVVHSINSQSVGLIRPTSFGLEKRAFKFNVSLPEDEYLETIGIIDTGISDLTPLSSIIVNEDNTFHYDGGNPRVDDSDHGTGVAAFAALGEKIIGDVTGTIEADAKLLSIKVLGSESGSLTNSTVENLIRQAYSDLGTRLFTLTICYEEPLRTNALISNYAYLLDKLAFDLDILIFICTANYRKQDQSDIDANDIAEYPSCLRDSLRNLCSPAESMNNLTIGAIGDNLEPESETAVIINSFPAIYTRKFHIDMEQMTQKNAHLQKPDILFSGGNYDNDDVYGVFPNGASAIQYLSSQIGQFFDRNVGTSFSTPLIANIAARILRNYPTLKLQTVKALIINGAQNVQLGSEFDLLTNHEKRSINGNGVPLINRCIFSSDNMVTMVIEDVIDPGSMKSYLLTLPEYLLQLDKSVGILDFTATLCFKFDPVLNNQLAYCPVHIAFGVFKNEELVQERVMKNNEDIKFKSNLGWSQDGFYRAKMYSNTQKVRFPLSKRDLINEDNQFRLAVNSKLHGVLSGAEKEFFNKEYQFSIVIRITEQLKEDKLTGRLYDELSLVNNLQVIGDADIELEGEA